MSARISPAVPPFPQHVQAQIDKLLPLVLFTTLARDERLFTRFFHGSLLDRGHLSLRNREIIIDRICALSKSEYEWGVHIAVFGEKARLSEEQIASTAQGGAGDPCWNAEERALIAACDQLHESCNIDDEVWASLEAHFSPDAIIELLMLAGKYRTVSYLTNALRLPLEDFARRFPERG